MGSFLEWLDRTYKKVNENTFDYPLVFYWYICLLHRIFR